MTVYPDGPPPGRPLRDRIQPDIIRLNGPDFQPLQPEPQPQPLSFDQVKTRLDGLLDEFAATFHEQAALFGEHDALIAFSRVLTKSTLTREQLSSLLARAVSRIGPVP